jgi:predicted DCC family thiol-disulfide oxidoreductase YuxK
MTTPNLWNLGRLTMTQDTAPAVAGSELLPGAAEIRLLYDGDCPLCSREIGLLRKLDRGRGRIGFEDIARLEAGSRLYGRDLETLLARIHGVLPSGEVIEGMEVFRRAYAAVGLGWLLAPTRWPLLRPMADAAYRWFARNRMRLTGRPEECTTGHCQPQRPASSPNRAS